MQNVKILDLEYVNSFSNNNLTINWYLDIIIIIIIFAKY